MFPIVKFKIQQSWTIMARLTKSQAKFLLLLLLPVTAIVELNMYCNEMMLAFQRRMESPQRSTCQQHQNWFHEWYVSSTLFQENRKGACGMGPCHWSLRFFILFQEEVRFLDTFLSRLRSLSSLVDSASLRKLSFDAEYALTGTHFPSKLGRLSLSFGFLLFGGNGHLTDTLSYQTFGRLSNLLCGLGFIGTT